MKLIPYRIVDNPQEDSFDEIYEFLVKGTSKEPYNILISVDDFNSDGKLVNFSCTCADFSIRKTFPNPCKHITKCLEILKENGIVTKIDE